MTVKKVTEEAKTYIAHQYVHMNAATDRIAFEYNISRRTVQRILVEMGVARTPRKPVKPAAPSFADTVPTAFVTEPTASIEMLPEPSWIEKSTAVIKRAVDKLFNRTHDHHTH